LGLPLIGDRGYSTLSLVRMCTEKKIPYIGTIQNNYLGGDYPIFPKDTNKAFKRRSYTYRMDSENIYITAYYDYFGKKPVIFISNFHTGEISKEYGSSHKERPMVAEIYSIHMCGVDLFDQYATLYNISRKTRKWTTRVAENIIGFSLNNSRVAYALANGYSIKKYNLKKYFLDILHQSYKHAWLVSTMEPVIKAPNATPKVCNWTGCKNRSYEPCANDQCTKQACKSHMALACLSCLHNRDINKLTFRKIPKNIPRTVCRQKDTNCLKRTIVSCAVVGCDKALCKTHRFKICADCAFHLSTPGNCSVKLLPRHIRIGN